MEKYIAKGRSITKKLTRERRKRGDRKNNEKWTREREIERTRRKGSEGRKEGDKGDAGNEEIKRLALRRGKDR